MARSNAQRFAIARAIARRKAASEADTKPVAAAPKASAVAQTPARAATTAAAPQSVHIDFQSASMKEGRTVGGQPYVSFAEGGQPVVVAFGKIAHAMKRDRLVKGMAVRERGMLKVVAIYEGETLRDERGNEWRKAA